MTQDNPVLKPFIERYIDAIIDEYERTKILYR